MALEGPQLPLAAPRVPLDGYAELSSDDMLKEGGSRPAILLLASDFEEYYCKGPSLMPDHPYLGSNEWIVGCLAQEMAIPIRAFDFIRWKESVFFGSRVLPNDRKMTGLSPQNWPRFVNAPAVAYPVVCLDIWTLNTDRHDQNYLGRVLGKDKGIFMVNDHDLALLPQGRTPEQLAEFTNVPVQDALVRSAVLRNAICDWAELTASIDRVRAVDDARLATIVGQVPDEWLDDHAKTLMVTFLANRRDHLNELFIHSHPFFPNLPEEAP